MRDAKIIPIDFDTPLVNIIPTFLRSLEIGPEESFSFQYAQNLTDAAFSNGNTVTLFPFFAVSLSSSLFLLLLPPPLEQPFG